MELRIGTETRSVADEKSRRDEKRSATVGCKCFFPASVCASALLVMSQQNAVTLNESHYECAWTKVLVYKHELIVCKKSSEVRNTSSIFQVRGLLTSRPFGLGNTLEIRPRLHIACEQICSENLCFKGT